MTEELLALPKELLPLQRVICSCASKSVWQLVKARVARWANPKNNSAATPEQEFVDHVLTHLRYLEHGGNINYNWLTKEGLVLWEFLKNQPDNWMDTDWVMPDEGGQ